MTITPHLEETLNEAKTLSVSDTAQVLAQWNTFLAHATSSYDQLDAVSHVLKALARESNAAYTYTTAWEQYQKSLVTDQELCCSLLEVMTLLSKARRSWDMVVTLLNKQPEPHETHYIHEKWYLENLLRSCIAASRALAELGQQVQNDVRPFAQKSHIALDSGFWFSVHNTEGQLFRSYDSTSSTPRRTE